MKTNYKQKWKILNISRTMNPLLVSLSFSFFTTTENQDINLVSVLILNNQKILDKIFRHKFM